MRTFLVMRYTPQGEPEYVTVDAHLVQYPDPGTAEFVVYLPRMADGRQPIRVARVMFNVEEVTDVMLVEQIRGTIH